jgi:hypothetical protein
MPIFYKDEDLKIFRNPTFGNVSHLLTMSGCDLMRGILADNGDLFVWAAVGHKIHVHGDIEHDFDIHGTRLDLNHAYVHILLAGGAQELLDSVAKQRAFLVRHGLPFADFDDHSVLSQISDAAIARVRSSLHIHRATQDPTFLVDIDPRVDWETRQRERVDTFHSAPPRRIG